MRDRFLKRINTYVIRYPRVILISALAVTVCCSLISILFLDIRNSRYDLISPNSPTGRRFKKFCDDFGTPESLIVCAESGSRRQTEKFVEKLAERLNRRTDIVRDVFYRKPLDFFFQYGLLFLPKEDLAELLSVVSENAGVMKSLSIDPSFESFYTAVKEAGEKQFKQRTDAILKGDSESVLSDVRLLRRITDGITASADALPKGEFQWDSLVPFAAEMESEAQGLDPYLAGNEAKMLFMFIQGRPEELKEKDGAVFVEKIRRIAAEVRAEGLSDVQFGFTGAPALAAEESLQTSKDMLLASIVAFAGVGIICILGFSELKRPLFGLLALTVSIAMTFAFTTLTIGYLNMITLAVAVTLVGLGVDFSIHVLDRYEENIRSGMSLEQSIDRVIRRTSPSIFTGAVTTALAFYAIMLSNFQGFAQLGFIGGSGILICCAVSIVLLPALLYLSGKHVRKSLLPPRGGLFLKMVQPFFNRPKLTLLVTFAVTAVSGAFALRTRDFDFNLLN